MNTNSFITNLGKIGEQLNRRCVVCARFVPSLAAGMRFNRAGRRTSDLSNTKTPKYCYCDELYDKLWMN